MGLKVGGKSTVPRLLDSACAYACGGGGWRRLGRPLWQPAAHALPPPHGAWRSCVIIDVELAAELGPKSPRFCHGPTCCFRFSGLILDFPILLPSRASAYAESTWRPVCLLSHKKVQMCFLDLFSFSFQTQLQVSILLVFLSLTY